MKSKLRVSVIQDDIEWQSPTANRKRYDNHIASLENTDLIVLPEMFSTGFYMKPWQCNEEMEGETIAWMQQQAANTSAVITGSLMMKLDEHYVNRMIWARPDGTLDWYDKRHLFRYGGEHHHFTGGNQRIVMNLYGWRVALFICYDLRFPVWSRNKGDIDVALYVANWPNARQYAWDSLLRARAIENQINVLGCNRLGKDENGNTFSGNSVILDFMGKPIVDCANHRMIANSDLSLDDLNQFRRSFPASMDADNFHIDITHD